MAICQPAWVTYTSGQDATLTTTLPAGTNVSGWTATLVVRAYNGGTALVTLSTGGSGLVINSGDTPTIVGTFSAANLALTHGPGAYVYDIWRTNSGSTFAIVDSSALVLTPAGSTSFPTLTNLSEYKVHALNDATLSTAQSKHLIQALWAAEDQIKRWCGRDFVYRSTVTEYYDGNGNVDLRLRRTPVDPTSLAIRVDHGGYGGTVSDSFAATTALTAGTDFYCPIDSLWNDGLSYSGVVKRIGTTWPVQYHRPRGLIGSTVRPLPGCIRVTYSGGFTLIPMSLKRAVWDLATQLSAISTDGRLVNSESGEGYSVGFGDIGGGAGAMMPHTLQAALHPFRRFVI